MIMCTNMLSQSILTKVHELCHYFLGYVLPRLIHCVEYSQLFRTYVQNTDCLLPDGNLIKKVILYVPSTTN